MNLSEELLWRGFVNQTTIKDLKSLDVQKKTFYMGFDASADSQTVGNLAAMMFIKTFLRHGYTGLLIAGGSTSLVGDPGGKDKERPLQSEETIATNVLKAQAQLQKICGTDSTILVNNLDWTKDLSVLDFLRNVGKYFSMTPLVQRDYIADRMGEGGSGISYTEFSYTLLQGLDYLHLYDTYGCTLQLGGSDQWGNCLSGVELVRKARSAEVDVMTLNLVINKSTGRKFGKSEAGAVWLDAEKTSAFAFFQFWLGVEDDAAEDYLKIFTDILPDELATVMEQSRLQPSERIAQTELAIRVSTIVHGNDITDTVNSAVQRMRQYLAGKAEWTPSTEDIATLKGAFPEVQSKDKLTLVQALAAGYETSTSEVLRNLKSNAISVNGIKVNADQNVTSPSALRIGKRMPILVV
jgi:tyrosyl-tRNA synthetase